MGYRRLRIDTPSLGSYYAVVDDEYAPHPLVSRWLEVRFFGRAQAEGTSAQYAGSLAVFLGWVERTGRDLPRAAHDLHLFRAYLSTTPCDSGSCAGRPRSVGRINRILVAVREFYRFAVGEGALPRGVLGDLYEMPSEDTWLRARNRPRVRHRGREPRRAGGPEQATMAEVIELIRSANTARDQLLIMLLALTGLRAGQALGLRRQDLHLVPGAAGLGLPIPGTGQLCQVPGEHLHIVRRRNPNGAWSKARFDFVVPVPAILLVLFDRYADEREQCLEAADNDMLIVALTGPTRGNAMSPRNLHKIFQRLAGSAGLRHIHPHMLRHFAASQLLASGTTHDELQALLGWASPASAEPYIHVDVDRMREAVDRLATRLTARWRNDLRCVEGR